LVTESVELAKGSSMEAREQRKNYYSKCRQVASGFVYESLTDSETRDVITFSENPKLEALEEIINDVPYDCKVVIFHVFNQSGQAICDRLKKMKIKYAAMNTLASGKKVDEYKKFKEDPKVKVLVVNIASGGEGLNLQVANYCIFFENTDRPDIRKQALKRTHRTGQEKHCYVYDLIMKASVELKILQFLEEGKSLFSALVEGSVDLKDVL
jgi:SNF2 family DNA or RNA helicase